MEIFLSKQCESLTGSLGRGFGYYIRSFYCKRKNVTHYYAQRSKHTVPADGHWRMILTCAELAQNKLHIADIKIGWLELQTALYEAKQFIASEQVRRNHVEKCKDIYDARDILNLKITFSL